MVAKIMLQPEIIMRAEKGISCKEPQALPMRSLAGVICLRLSIPEAVLFGSLMAILYTNVHQLFTIVKRILL